MTTSQSGFHSLLSICSSALTLTRLNELLSAMMFIEYHHACLNNSHHLEVCIHYNTLDQDSYIAEFESVSGVSAIEGLLKY